jgi:hypothetical protein
VRGTIVPTTPFLKLTVGADMTIAGKLYINMQYIHGFIDEFGSGKAVHALNNPLAAKDQSETPRVEQRLGDYIVAGADVHLASDRLLLRVFAVIKLPSLNFSPGAGESVTDEFQLCDPAKMQATCYKFTGVLFPQLIWSVWEATELSVGGFIFIGDRTTKFGDPAAGASEVFAKAKFSF